MDNKAVKQRKLTPQGALDLLSSTQLNAVLGHLKETHKTQNAKTSGVKKNATSNLFIYLL